MADPAPMLPHYLRPLLAPSSIAVVGASEQSGSLGRIVFENLLGSDFRGAVHAVNPHHRNVLGRPCHRRLASIGAPIDLALVAVAARRVESVIADAAKAGVHALLMLTDPAPADATDRHRWIRELTRFARRHDVRLVGPGAFGVVRSDIGLNASVTDVPVARGRLALVAQSGAVCAAMLDFAAPLGIGFSTVLSIGGAIDVDFGEVLDALLLDNETDGILLYVEVVHDARRFVSALRAAARTKPVIVLRAGRSHDVTRARSPSADAVFDAAMRRAGTVRVHTYTQLFAAARILSMGRIPRGDAIAIVANGRGPGVLAADTAVERGVRLATLSATTRRRLHEIVADDSSPSNPVDVHSDAPPERFAAAVATVLDDAAVDAVVALHVPRATIGATDTARAVAAVSRASDKPVLGAWLGALDRHEAREALEAGGIANFYTPENAVEAFSFLAAYRRHQEWLLEVPPPQPEPTPPDAAAADAVRRETSLDRATTLDHDAATRLLRAFGIAASPRIFVETADAAKLAARQLGYPVALSFERARIGPVVVHDRLRDARSVAHAFEAIVRRRDAPARAARGAIVVRKDAGEDVVVELAVGVRTDPVFGPVIVIGAARGVPPAEPIVMLPPLNRRLAGDIVDVALSHRRLHMPAGESREGLVRLLLQLSTLVCASPWVIDVELDPVVVNGGGVVSVCARVRTDGRRARLANYAHMAIHPYPAELESEFVARNGTRVQVRPIRPEDASREQRFVEGLSEQSRFFRFFYRMQQLTPAMLARFTQVDYDRELALIALVPDASGVEGTAIVGVARYIENADRASAEYAVVVADAWHREGIGRALMHRLIAAARRKGLKRLEGVVLRENATMLQFVAQLGFTTREDAGDAEQVITELALR